MEDNFLSVVFEKLGFIDYLKVTNPDALPEETDNLTSKQMSEIIKTNEEDFQEFIEQELEDSDYSFLKTDLKKLLEDEISTDGFLISEDTDITSSSDESQEENLTDENNEAVVLEPMEDIEVETTETETEQKQEELTDESQTEIAAEETPEESLIETKEEETTDKNLEDSAPENQAAGENSLVQVEDEIIAEDKNIIDENTLKKLINELLLNQDFIDKYDSDEDGILSPEEIKFALQEINLYDGDEINISLEDIISAYENLTGEIYGNEEEIKTEEIDEDAMVESESEISPKEELGDVNETETDETLKLGDIETQAVSNQEDSENGLITDSISSTTPTESLTPLTSTGSSPVSTYSAPTSSTTGTRKRNTHATNYTEPDGSLSSEQLETQKQEQIAQIDSEIQNKNNEKAEYFSQNEEYKLAISELNNITTNISSVENNIDNLETQLHSVEYDIEAYNEELSNIPDDALVFKEKASEYQNKKSELKAKIKEAEAEAQSLQDEIESNQSELEKLNEQKEIKENEIAVIEAENPSEQIELINSEINSLETTRLSTIAEFDSKIAAARKQEKEDAKVYGRMKAYRESELVSALLDSAVTQETKDYWDQRYARNGGAYCAAFTKDITSDFYKKAANALGLNETFFDNLNTNGDANNSSQGLAGLSFAGSVASNKIWGDKVQSAIDAVGLNVDVTIDITNMSAEERKNAVRDGKIKPGQIFTYMENGRLHTGFIESINKDMSWNTIEGNTAIRYSDGSYEQNTVGSHVRDTDFGDLTSVTDPTVKVLYWLIASGYSTSDLNSLMA